MHLWPTSKVQKSFKQDYLKRLDRIRSERRQGRQSWSTILDPNYNYWRFDFCRELLVIFTCCFCFGVFSDEDDSGYM